MAENTHTDESEREPGSVIDGVKEKKPATGRRSPAVIITILTGILLSVAAFLVQRGIELNRIKDEFHLKALNRVNMFQKVMDEDLEVLEGLRALFLGVGEEIPVSRRMFRTYAKSALLKHNTIQALEWIPAVPIHRLEEFETAARRDGFPDFHIKQAGPRGKMVAVGQREYYFPVFYVEPYKGNEIALGFDLASNHTRRRALDLARDAGTPAASGRIRLVQETGGQYGILVFLPVYSRAPGHTPPTTAAQRRSALKGFVLGVFRIGEMLEKSMDYLKETEDINIHMFDESGATGEQFLYSHLVTQTRPAGNHTLTSLHTVDVADRRWRFQCESTPGYVGERRLWWLWGVLIGGLLFTALLAAYLSATFRRTLMVEQQVEERTHQLQQANLQLKKESRERMDMEARLRQAQKMESIGTLAGGIAHDFNNILGAMMGFTELSLLDAPDDTQLKYNLEQILASSMRAKDLVWQILTFSRKSEPNRKPLPLDSLIQEVIKLLRASLPSTIDIRYASAVSDRRDWIHADSTQIHQVLMNLGSNAAIAMSGGPGVLDLKLSREELDERAVQPYHQLSPGPYLTLEVQDTGEGIPDTIIDRIFDPFFTTREVGKGTGLGLAVVHGIVKNHGGDIVVHSEPGNGARFTVLLPAIQPEDSQDEGAAGPVLTGKESILLVDDEEKLLDAGKRILESLGYTVTALDSGPDALERFKQAPGGFDLVITDQTMKHMTGSKLADKLIEIRPDIPIILCTGFSDTTSLDTTETHIKQLVLKPFGLEEIAGIVRKVLDQSRP